jgi:hypothetical protein
MHQTTVGGRRGDEQTSRIFEAPPLRHGEEGGLRGEDVGGVRALCSAEDAITDAEAWGRSGGWNCGDGAGEFGTADPGEWWLVLVFALDLEDVEEVCAGGVDLDEVFVGGRGGGWDIGDCEV